ncbi:hypothetical protein PRZ48_005177 [Zasmidium cellare]|uniref:RING-type domain-containing protein n=1 Tax=Zasmidium cellare TaxID=395010 RepID=A0ABR0ET23_ZASCE|nr:hypothetical protein PRZ48_005177 [Zasmidium cellare]
MGNSNSTTSASSLRKSGRFLNKDSANAQEAAPSARNEFASALEPHHEIRIEYPVVELLNDDEVLVFPPMEKRGERYQPLPLVPDDGIDDNYPWFHYENSLRTTLHRSSRVLKKRALPEELSNTDDLASRMNKLVEYLGMTIISAVTYSTNGEHRVRLCVDSCLARKEAKGKNLEPAKFDYSVKEWVQMPRGPDGKLPLWHTDITSLACQVLDRDVRHVEFMLNEAGYDYNEEFDPKDWKARRQISITEGIATIAKTMTKPELAEHNQALPPADRIEQCPICYEEYNDIESSGAVTVILPCSSNKHCICYDCFQSVCESSGLPDTLCPYCRKQVASPDLAPRMGPNYLDIDAPFTYDARFTAFENRERSFAAIDRLHPWDDTTSILIDKDVFIESWNQVVPHSFDPEDRTPDRLIPVQAPETWYFFKSFLDTIRALDGQRMEAKDLYHLLNQNALKAMRAQYLANGMGEFLPRDELKALLADESRFPVRVGLAGFIEKSVNRVVMLPIQRACYEHREHITEANPMGLHGHGDNLFWCPKIGTILQGKPKELRPVVDTRNLDGQ